MTKSLYSALALPLLLIGCSGAEETGNVSENDDAVESVEGGNMDAGEAVSAESDSDVAGGGEALSAPADGTSSENPTDETTSDGDAGAGTVTSATTSGATKPKSKFLQTYDKKRRVTFLKQCEPELAKDLEPGQSEEACRCIFDELTPTLDGIKERLNPPDAKVDVANEKCLTKYL